MNRVANLYFCTCHTIYIMLVTFPSTLLINRHYDNKLYFGPFPRNIRSFNSFISSATITHVSHSWGITLALFQYPTEQCEHTSFSIDAATELWEMFCGYVNFSFLDFYHLIFCVYTTLS